MRAVQRRPLETHRKHPSAVRACGVAPCRAVIQQCVRGYSSRACMSTTVMRRKVECTHVSCARLKCPRVHQVLFQCAGHLYSKTTFLAHLSPPVDSREEPTSKAVARRIHYATSYATRTMCITALPTAQFSHALENGHRWRGRRHDRSVAWLWLQDSYMFNRHVIDARLWQRQPRTVWINFAALRIVEVWHWSWI